MSEANATAANIATAAPASAPPFVFPEALPLKHECDWLTNSDAKQKLDARCVGIKLSTDKKGQPLVYIALRLEPGQQALDATTNVVRDFGGNVSITQRYMTPNAQDSTKSALRILGLDPTRARAAYAKDAQALSLVQQIKAGGGTDEDIESAMTLLAMQRGDIAACGLGSKIARIDSKNDTFTTSKGEEIVTRKINWIEAIPEAVGADQVLALAKSFGSFAPPKAAPKVAGAQKTPAKATSAPPKAATDPDDVNF